MARSASCDHWRCAHEVCRRLVGGHCECRQDVKAVDENPSGQPGNYIDCLRAGRQPVATAALSLRIDRSGAVSIDLAWRVVDRRWACRLNSHDVGAEDFNALYSHGLLSLCMRMKSVERPNSGLSGLRALLPCSQRCAHRNSCKCCPQQVTEFLSSVGCIEKRS